MNYKTLFIIFILISSLYATSQDAKLIIGEKYRHLEDSNYNKHKPAFYYQSSILGSSENYIFTLDISEKDNILEITKFDSNANKLVSAPLGIGLPEKKTKYVGCSVSNSRLTHLLSQIDGETGTLKVYAVQMDENLDLIGSPLLIANPKKSQPKGLGMSVSEDQSKICFWSRNLLRRKENVSTAYWVYAIQENKVIWNKVVDHETKSRDIKILHTSIDNDGTLYSLIRKKRKKEKINRGESKTKMIISAFNALTTISKEVDLVAPEGKEFCSVAVNTEASDQILVIATFQKLGVRQSENNPNYRSMRKGSNGILTRIYSKKELTLLSSKDLPNFELTTQNKLKEQFLVSRLDMLPEGGWIVMLKAFTLNENIGDYFQWIRLDNNGGPKLNKKIKLNMKRFFLVTELIVTPKYTGLIIEDDQRNLNFEEGRILQRGRMFLETYQKNRMLRMLIVDNETGEISKKTLLPSYGNNIVPFVSFRNGRQINNYETVIPWNDKLLKIKLR